MALDRGNEFYVTTQIFEDQMDWEDDVLRHLDINPF